MNNPFFSIISPNFNSGKKLLRAAESLASNAVDYEHIVIDDCSTDDSIEILEAALDSIVIIKNDINIGAGPSRNKGLKVARGRYCMFLDSDDFFVPGALDFIMNALVSGRYPEVFVFGYKLLREKERQVLSVPGDFSCTYFSPTDNEGLLKKYLLDEIVSAPWSKCFSMTLAKSIMFPDNKVGEDAVFNLDAFSKTTSAIITDSKLYVFDRTNSESLTSKPFSYNEFSQFYESWLKFERVALRLKNINEIESLVVARKVKFCVLYCMTRLAHTPESELDPRVIKEVRNLFLKNVRVARKHLSGRAIGVSYLFCVAPRFTLRLLRQHLRKSGE